jgi:integrase
MRKTRRPVVFDISGAARAALRAYLDVAKLSANAPLFPRADNAKGDAVQAISTEAYRRKVHVWADVAGHRDTSAFGTHSLRKTRPALIYAAEKDVAVCSRLLGHTDTKATLTYLGIDTQAAIAVARRYEV